MKIYVLTLFPEMIQSALSESVIGRAQAKGILQVECINFRDYSKDSSRHVDDYPYGGGAGMVLKAQPIYDAYIDLKKRAEVSRVIYMTPQGEVFKQKKAEELSKEEDLVILCGHYEGVDERLINKIVTDELSIGDYVLTGGELAAMVVIDAVARLVPGVLKKEESHMDESFSMGLLEYPQYTRPYDFNGQTVPDVLLSGHHGNVAKWRREQSILRTYEKRRELLKDADLTEAEKKLLHNYYEMR